MNLIIGGQAVNASTSSVILILQLSIVFIMAMYLLKVELENLKKDEQRKKIGNLYLGLNTEKRSSLIYSCYFYV
jgi:hypothetical protein